MQEDELQLWFIKNSITVEAQDVINRIRESEPSRCVKSSASNVSGRYPSRKMGHTIQFESHKNEFCFIREYEHSDDVIEYYDQPEPIKLIYQGKNKKRLGVIHTPDFFVIRKGSAGWEECKKEEKLLALSEKSPDRYQKEKDGTWRCPPGEDFAKSFGLYYRLRSSSEINWIKQRNLIFLEDYLRSDTPKVSELAHAYINAVVTADSRINLLDLIERIRPASADDVYTLIADDELYVDLNSSPLAEPARVYVFKNKNIAKVYEQNKDKTDNKPSCTLIVNAQIGKQVLWDGRPFEIVNTGENNIWLRGKDNNIIEIELSLFETLVMENKLQGMKEDLRLETNDSWKEKIMRASPEDQMSANTNYEAILPFLYGAKPVDGITKNRQIYRLIRKYREAEIAYGNGYVGLLPRHSDKGNTRPKLPEQTLKLMSEFIEKEFETIKQKKILSVFGSFLRACEKTGCLPSSYKTFCAAVRKRPAHEQTSKRQGRRAAYPHEPFYLELTMTTPRHGDRPFEICHIDHTELDIELVDTRTGRNLGRPWLTIMTDAYSRRFLAIFLTYDAPSYRSCMMVIRECVRRHGRFPQIIVVDGGSEFRSVYFETLLAHYECTKKTRPPAKGRFGSTCERLFGTTNTQFVYNLTGNTQITKEVRKVTKSVNPKGQAIWTLYTLYENLCKWAYELYDSTQHPALFQSPKDAFAAGMIRSGDRLNRLISYNEEFYFETLPTTQKGTAKVIPNKGAKINNIYYWSDRFRNPEIENKKVPVRYDPFNAGIAYAYVNNFWIECISEYYAIFQGRTERELGVATAEMRKKSLLHSRQFDITAKRLADAIASVEVQEAMMLQQARDREVKSILEIVKTDNNQGGSKLSIGAEEPSVRVRDNSAELRRDMTQKLDVYEDF